MDAYTNAYCVEPGVYVIPGDTSLFNTEGLPEGSSEFEGIILRPGARQQLESLRRQAIAYERDEGENGRPLREREVTLLFTGQVENGNLLVEEVEARNHLNATQATAVRGVNWIKIVIGALGIVLGIVLQLRESEYDATAYGIGLALLVSAMESFFINTLKKPDPALRGDPALRDEYQV